MGLGPLFMFLISHRFYDSGTTGAREKHSVVYTNLALLAIVVVAALTIGLDKYILIQAAHRLDRRCGRRLDVLRAAPV